MRIEENFALLPYNTFGLNVFCRQFCEYDTISELEDLIQSSIFKRSDWLHIGGGSNLLFLNEYNDLFVLHSQLKGIEIMAETQQECLVRVGAGEVWDHFVDWCVKQQLGGVENLSLIPGEVGAAPVQNIGAYGMEVKDVIQSVETLSTKDGSFRIFQNNECRFSYRSSLFKQLEKQIVTYVIFRLRKFPFYQFNMEYGQLKEAFSSLHEITLANVRNTIIAIRNEKLPVPERVGNAGSFFKNPVISKALFLQLQKKYPLLPHYPTGENEEKIPAGWLIEQCGWKGKSHKQAAVYDKQALVLINKGGATGNEIWELANQIQQSVFEKFGVRIEPEVKVVDK